MNIEELVAELADALDGLIRASEKLAEEGIDVMILSAEKATLAKARAWLGRKEQGS